MFQTHEYSPTAILLLLNFSMLSTQTEEEMFIHALCNCVFIIAITYTTLANAESNLVVPGESDALCFVTSRNRLCLQPI